MVVQYKCPSCGTDMVFDSQSGKLKCESCGRQDNIDTMSEAEPSQSTQVPPDSEPEEPVGDFDEFEEHTSTNTFGENEAAEYQCNNCGAVIIADADTTATACSFCGAPVMLSDRLSGSFAPSLVIPFSISKEQAQEAFKKWCRKGLLTPKDFMTADRIKHITGIYIPFWLYHLNGRGEVHGTATKVRTYTSGDYIYTETKYYDIYRKADLNFLNVPADASEKMDDTMMDKLEPFEYKDLKDFKIPYLAGYIAEKYNYTDKDLFPRVKARAEKYVKTYIDSTLTGYSSIHYDHSFTDVKQRDAHYSLLPVWMVCYDYRQAQHNFAMNGQTGKIVGTPPLSKGKMAAWFAGLAGASFLILKIIGILMGGPLI